MNGISPGSIRLRIPGEARFLFLVRAIVTAIAESIGLPEIEVDKVEVAVDEACTNVLDHAYSELSSKPPIDIEVTVDEKALVVDIIDYGNCFDFSSYTPPRFPDHWLDGQTRGVGLYLIHQCMDGVSYEPLSERQNRLRLTKRRNCSTNAQPAGALGQRRSS